MRWSRSAQNANPSAPKFLFPLWPNASAVLIRNSCAPRLFSRSADEYMKSLARRASARGFFDV
jgi:hypothetical protein